MGDFAERLAEIRRRVEWLRNQDDATTVFGSDQHGYRIDAALSEDELTAFEGEHDVALPGDGLWGRVGSSNLNNASLLGNFELDVCVLDEDLARQLEGLFLADLASSVEIVLPRYSMSLYGASEREDTAGEPPTI